MAQEDILYYTITYRTDMTSLRDAADQLTQAFDQMQKATPKEILPGTGEAVQDLQKVAEATQTGIKTLVDLQKEIEGYRTELKLLEEQQKLGIDLTDAQREQQAQLKVALKAASQEYNRQSQDLVSLSRASGESAKTYNELVKANKAISAELRNLPLDDTSGRLKELQDQYKANNDRLKEFDASMGNHQRNVGNYEGSLKNVIGSLTSLQGASGQVTQGIGIIGQAFQGSVGAFQAAGGGVRGFGLALKATGIGLFLPLLSGLVSIFGQIQPVVDVANRVVQAFSVTLKTVADRFLGLLEAGRLFLRGDFSEAAEKAKASFSGLGEEIVNNVRANDQFTQSLLRLKRAEADLTVERARANKELAQARLESRDANRSIEERIVALQKAIAIEEQIAAEEMRLAKQRADVLEAQVALTTSSDEEIAELREAQARVIELQTQSIMRQSEATERLNTLRNEGNKQAIADQERLNAELATYTTYLEGQPQALADVFASLDELVAGTEEDVQSRATAELEFFRSMEQLKTESAIEALRQRGDLEAALQAEKQARFLELEQQYLDAGISAQRAADMAKEQSSAEFRQAEADLTAQSVEFQKQQLLQGANAAIAIGENLFGKSKALAVARAIIDTFASANAAFKDTPGNVVIRALAAGAAITAGLANVRKILSTKPGKGAPSGGGGSAPSLPGISGTIAGTGVAETRAGAAVVNGGTGADIPATINTALAGFANRGTTPINVEAKVDREGLALAVRDGEQALFDQSITYS